MILQLANVLSTEALFYTCIIPFIMFFGAFAFVFYPLRDVLHPTGAGSEGCSHRQCIVCTVPVQTVVWTNQQPRLVHCSVIPRVPQLV